MGNLVPQIAGAGNLRAALLVSAWVAASGCLPVHYALQAGAGQLELLLQRRPIDEALESPRTSRRAKQLLPEVERIKRFAEAHAMRATGSYRTYVQLQRGAVVYPVSACPELSLTAQTWSFPLVGSVPYLGWFRLRAAEEFARGLRDEGQDAEVRGASAYSTLGWFDDPVLSSMLPPGPAALGDLAEVVLHESVHATVYVPGQSPFNEGLASFASEQLTPLFLAERSGPGSRATRAFFAERERGREQREQLHRAAVDLAALYADATLTADEKRARKAAQLAGLQNALGWKRAPNNATLAQHLAYQAGTAGFLHVLTACAGSFDCFFQAMGRLTPADFHEPQQAGLDELLDQVAARVPTATPAAPPAATRAAPGP